MQVSFIIPLFNCLPFSQACLNSLRRSLPEELTHEIILVDNGSTDGTGVWLSELAPPVRVLRNPANLGYARANNRGADAARGEWLCLLNNDLLFAPGWFEPMFALAARLGPAVGAIGNVQRRVVDRAVDHSGIFINAQCKPEHDRAWYPWPRQWRRVPAVTGACLLVRRATFLDLGGFDEQYQNGGEDVDLCLRLSAAGRFNAVALRSRILHHVSATPGRKLKDEENSRRLAEKWRHQLQSLAARRWCWHELERTCLGTGDAALWRDALSLLAHSLQPSPQPPAVARRGVARHMDREFARWQKLLGSSSDA